MGLRQERVRRQAWYHPAVGQDDAMLVVGGLGLLGLGALGAWRSRGGSRSEDVEALAARCAPEAVPGIRQELGPGEVVLYRTSRSRGEAERVCEALERGEPGEAFRASKRIHPQLTGHGGDYKARLRAARQRGARPLFTTPFPSTAYFYRSHAAEAPVSWALIVPEDAVIWTNNRTYNTSGIFYSLTYPDAEVVVDARKVRRVFHLPAHRIESIGRTVKALADDNIVRGAFRHHYKDRDPELAVAARRAVVDLRLPPPDLGRPFREVPLPTAAGGVMKGQRVLLRDGQIARLRGVRELRVGPDVRRQFWRGHDQAFSASGFIEWMGSQVGLEDMALTEDWFVRPLAKGERVSRGERVATWEANRSTILRWVVGWADLLRRVLVERGEDPKVRAALGWAERDLELLSRADPPWLNGKAVERQAKDLRYGTS